MSDEQHKDAFDINRGWNRKLRRRYSIFDETDAIDEKDGEAAKKDSIKSSYLNDHLRGGRPLAQAKPHDPEDLPPILKLPKQVSHTSI